MRAIVSVLVIASVANTYRSLADELGDAVDKIAQQAIESESAVCLSVAIAEGDKVVLSQGYGLANVELQSEASADTVYRIGSITKQFTAAAILLLVEEGKLGLDDPLSKHLPEFPKKEKAISIRHLLQHTSGIKSFTSLPSYQELMRQDVSHADILKRFVDEPLQFTPGKKYQYSNSGFYLLGVVIENVSKMAYDEFLQEKIFSPLNMEHTYYDRSEKIIPGRAQGYARWGGKLRNSSFLSMTQPFAAGALASSAEDLVLWQRALVNHQLLTEDSFRQLTTPGKLADGKSINYGLGTVLRKKGEQLTIGHGGGINGFRSSLVYYPKSDLTIVVLANCENTQTAAISAQIAEFLLKR